MQFQAVQYNDDINDDSKSGDPDVIVVNNITDYLADIAGAESIEE